MELTLEFDGDTFRKSTFSGAQNDCLYLPEAGDPNRVGDSKSGQVLRASRSQLVGLASLVRA